MKSTPTFNNISEQLKKEIPKLKMGETVVFQMLNGVPNADPDERERYKTPVLYGKTQVRTYFKIYDPYKKDFVEIGCVDTWVRGEPDRLRFFVPGQGEYSRFQGKFELHGGNVKDEELYEVLWLSPEREGSPCPDANIAPLFKILDAKHESKGTISKLDTLREVLDIVKSISDQDAQNVMSALGQPHYQDPDVLRAKIGTLAKEDPDLFLKTYKSKDTQIKATLRRAMEEGVITHNIQTGEILMGKTPIAAFKVTSTNELMADFARFVNTAENGQDVYANLKLRLEEKKSEKV